MKTREYIRPSDIDSITIKQCDSVENFKIKNITGALAALGIEVGFNVAAGSLMFGGASVLLGAAPKQKNVVAKFALGTSGGLIALAAGYACSEAIENALENTRSRIDWFQKIADEYATEDGYIYYYEYTSKQNHDPKKPILKKTRAECISKAVKLLSIATSNKDSRVATHELKTVELMDEDAITAVAWSLWHKDSESMKEVGAPDWMKKRGDIFDAAFDFSSLYGDKPAVWLQKHDKRFQNITTEACKITKLLYKDNDRSVSETAILYREWEKFKEMHGYCAPEWVRKSEFPLEGIDTDKGYFFSNPDSAEIEKEAKTIIDDEGCDCTAEECAELQKRRELFVAAFGKTPEEYLGTETATKAETDPENEGVKAEDVVNVETA